MTSTSPASMGGPLSEAERIAEIRRGLKMAKLASANAPGTFWHTFTENAEFLLELVGVLEGQLATARGSVLGEIAAEQAQQEAKFGEQNHVDGTGPYVTNPDRMSNMEDQSAVARRDCQEAAEAGRLSWMLVLREEVYEAFAEENPAALRAELVQVAAVAATWIEAIDRRTPAALGLDGGNPDAE